jgi:hypothetical protein
MKTIASVACILCLGLPACAAGAGTGDGLFSDAGTSIPADTGPVIISQPPGTPPPATGTDAAVDGFPGTPIFDAGGGGVLDDAGGGGPGGGYDSGGYGYGGYDGGGYGGYDGGGYEGYDSGGYGYGGYDGGGYGYGSDAGGGGSDDAGGTICQGYASPAAPASCTCTASNPSECQTNGCFNGYFCDTITNTCEASAPSGC